MKNSIFGLVAVLALLGSLMGLAMAGTSEATSELAQADSSIPDDGVSSTMSGARDDSRPSTSIDDGDDSTTTSIEDEGDEGDDDGTTLTTIEDEGDEGDDDGTTSTTIDDEGDEGDDDGTTSTTIDDHGTVADQVLSKEIPGVGTVTVEVRSDRLQLVSVSAPGWDVAVEAGSTEIKVKFRNGSSEVEFEAELEDGRVKIKIENHSS